MSLDSPCTVVDFNAARAQRHGALLQAGKKSLDSKPQNLSEGQTLDAPSARPSRSWDVTFITTLRNEALPELEHVVVSWVIRTNHLARSYQIDVYGEGRGLNQTLRGAYRPTDTATQRVRHDAIYGFVSDLMAASYGLSSRDKED
jgi:hypothetical protein